MKTDRHKFLDKAEPENEPAGICSFSWGNRELRIFGEQMTLQVNGISHDMTSVLDELRDIGAKPRPVIRSDVWKLRVAGMINRCRWIYCKTSKLHIKY